MVLFAPEGPLGPLGPEGPDGPLAPAGIMTTVARFIGSSVTVTPAPTKFRFVSCGRAVPSSWITCPPPVPVPLGPEGPDGPDGPLAPPPPPLCLGSHPLDPRSNPSTFGGGTAPRLVIVYIGSCSGSNSTTNLSSFSNASRCAPSNAPMRAAISLRRVVSNSCVALRSLSSISLASRLPISSNTSAGTEIPSSAASARILLSCSRLFSIGEFPYGIQNIPGLRLLFACYCPLLSGHVYLQALQNFTGQCVLIYF